MKYTSFPYQPIMRVSGLCLVLLISACSSNSDKDSTSAPPSVKMPKAQYVNAGDQVELSAEATDDIGVETMEWMQISGTEVGLNGRNTNTLTFTAPNLDNGELLEFKFLATDAQGQIDSGFVEVTVNPVQLNTTTVNVNITGGTGIDFSNPDVDLVIVAGQSLTPVTSEGEVQVEISTETGSQVIALSTNDGNPLLMTYAGATDGEIELSLESSADAFVIRSPRFFGSQIVDMPELSNRIRAHQYYPKLLEVLAQEIPISPCPMDQACNASSAYIAELIAQGLDLSGLVVAGE